MKCIYNVGHTQSVNNCLRIRVYVLDERTGFANFTCIYTLINETNIKFDMKISDGKNGNNLNM